MLGMIFLTILDVTAVVIGAYAFANYGRMEAKEVKNGALLLGLLIFGGHLIMCLL